MPSSAVPKPSTPKRNFLASGPNRRVSRANRTIMVNLATSEGWNWIPPMVIHRLAPLTS